MIEPRKASRAWLLGRLKHSLQLLASPADTQLGELPQAGHKSDALSLSFNHWRMALLDSSQSEISAHQQACLGAIQQKFGRMGSESWTDGAVSHSAEWKEIRSLSTKTLEAFGWLT